ncbi:MAG: GNAT family N-acetyltransferase [Clostridia bacterium]|nr:GNAT family N-acetyltransferase [Clostridia bacterium]
MIKKLSDLSDIRGSLPLMSVIQTDSVFFATESEGAYCQEIDGVKTLIFSVRGTSATICKLTDAVDEEELSTFLHFHHITEVVSDFPFGDFSFEKVSVLKAKTSCNEDENITALLPSSRLCDYENVFRLLSSEGDFEAWYPSFSRKVNNLAASGVYLSRNSIPVSCAIAPFVWEKTCVIAGVYTHPEYRNKGFASRCVKALLGELNKMDCREAYLWCEEENIKFYEREGFSRCGKIYVKKEE